jgi:acyl CoA:acetate/3-ketoacid CoA transferase alpha subunit
MQQGKMFLFIGVVMAVTQGGFVRRIKAGKEGLHALVVRKISGDMFPAGL